MPTGTTAIEMIGCMAVSALLAYAGGRFHQWYELGLDRDRSFREGYEHAYHALFGLASRRSRSTTDSSQQDGQVSDPPHE